MTYVVKNVGWALSLGPPVDIGKFLESYRDTTDGRGEMVFTSDIRCAMQFATAGEAVAYTRAASRTVPLRPDGRPNKPMTAMTIEVGQYADAAFDATRKCSADGLSDEEKLMLRWLADSEYSQYGECFGSALDMLIVNGLVQGHSGREFQKEFIVQGDDAMHQAVSLTAAGRELVKELC